MGLFDGGGIGLGDIINPIGSGIKRLTGSDILGGIANPIGYGVERGLGELLGRNPNSPSDMGDPVADARKQQLIKQQEDAIGQFDKQRSGLMGQAVRSSDSATRAALDNRLRGVKNDASRRGILHSGVRYAGESDARVGAAQQFNQNRQILNKSFDRVRENMQNLLNRMKFNQAEEAVIMADQVYDQALAAAEQDRGFIGNLMGAGGTAAGMIAASRSGSPQSTTADTSGMGSSSYNQPYQSGNVTYSRGLNGYLR